MKTYFGRRTFSALIIATLFSTLALAQEREDPVKWDPKKNITAALQETRNIAFENPNETIIGIEGPSPSNQALVVFETTNGNKVLLCRDYDPRLDAHNKPRITYGTYKASYGLSLPKNHSFNTTREAVLEGSPNTILYDMFSPEFTAGFTITFPSISYSERGEDWGPAITVPVIISGKENSKIDLTLVEKIIEKLNQTAQEKFDNRNPKDIMTGRFRDFALIDLTDLSRTGSDISAVTDENKLETITVNGETLKLWDEASMRKNLLPHIRACLNK